MMNTEYDLRKPCLRYRVAEPSLEDVEILVVCGHTRNPMTAEILASEARCHARENGADPFEVRIVAPGEILAWTGTHLETDPSALTLAEGAK